ncbi:hypothetical protein GOODEAATRI_014542 [Goodea atripinnis]|uniref:Uncharacterized protein n=1 Tax=Goodea atripinnis TaxID=208336 RepID=A0ABV0MHY5_9TELE
MRKDYITAKYTEKRFAQRLFADAESRLQALYAAVRSRDILSLIQVYAEGVDLMEAIPQPNEHEPGETVLHLAVRMVDRNSLHIVDFLAQNSPDHLTVFQRQPGQADGQRKHSAALLLPYGQQRVSEAAAEGESFSPILKASPSRREERPISCIVSGSGSMQPNFSALARDAALIARDKQRPPIPSSMISNETYGTMLEVTLPPLGPTPPVPPRGPNRGLLWIAGYMFTFVLDFH